MMGYIYQTPLLHNVPGWLQKATPFTSKMDGIGVSDWLCVHDQDWRLVSVCGEE